MPSGVVPHYRQCLLVWCLTISQAYWCVASLYVMPSGAVPHYHPCLLVCCLTIGHAFWCGASLSAMPVGVVPHYRPCLLAWYFTIGHAFWSIATAINILPVECRWKKGGYKSGATCTEVSLYQRCLMIQCHTQICLLVQCNYIKHACWVHEFIYAFCKDLLLDYQARYLVCYKSIRHAYR